MVMRVFVAGGTGVVGRRLVPQLPSDRRPVTLTRRALGPGHPPPTPDKTVRLTCREQNRRKWVQDPA